MPSVTVTAQYVNARQGNKPPSIKGRDGHYYNMDDEKFATVQQGGTYTIEYTETPGRLPGRTYKVVSRITPAQNGAAPQGGGGKYGSQDMGTAERIFVCGALNATLSNPNFNLQEISPSGTIALVNMFRTAWKETFGGQPSAATEMQDEIPYA